MKRSLKFLTAITLSLLLVFGSSLGAFAGAKNTSIHLHLNDSIYTVLALLSGGFSETGVYDPDLPDTVIPLANKGGGLFTSTDFSAEVSPIVKHFIINDEIWKIPENIREGKESKGTINYWMANSPTYKVEYKNANSNATGTPPVDTYMYFEGELVTVMDENDLKLDGYTFGGWTSDSNGIETFYTANSEFLMPPNNVVLNAKWIPELPPPPTPFEVIYNANNDDAIGDVPDDLNSYFEGSSVIVLGNIGNLEVEGYTFEGWETQILGFDTSYNGGETFNMPDHDVELFAIWKLIPTYSLTYDENGATSGSVPIDLNKYHEYDAATVLDNTGDLVLNEFVFDGWNTEISGLGTPYDAGSKYYMPDHDVTLYAKWIPELPPPPTTYSLTYNGNGATSGTAPAPPTSYITGTKVTVLDNSGGYDISGMNFDGWNTDANGNGVAYAPGMELTIGMTDVVLYAQWSREIPITGTITIQKTVTGVSPSPVEIFEFRIIGYDGEESYTVNEEPIYVKEGDPFIYSGLSVGRYYVKEINIPKNYTLRDDDPQEAIIGIEIGYHPIVRFENIYTEPRGSITVNKTLTGDTPPANSAFTFRLVGPAGEGSTSTELSRTGAGAVTFSGLTYGTYTLTEVGLPSNFSIVSDNNLQLSIHEESRNIAANITNRYTKPTPPPPGPTPPPVEPTPERGTVRVHHIDIDENILVEIFEFTGPVGTNYATAAREFDDLELVETPENATGTFIDGIIDVFYVYTPGVEPLVILEVEEETPLGPPVVPEEEIVLTEPVPLAPLPQTGQLPAELFYGFGSLISMIGVVIRKGRKTR